MIPFPRAILAISIGVVLGGVVAWQVIEPVKGTIAERFRLRGDTYLVEQNYDQAISEYQKSLHYNSQNQVASHNLQLAEQGSTDPATLKEFFSEHNQTEEVKKIEAAQTLYTNPKEALAAGVTLYEQKDFAFARYPLERAVALDPQYPEAWNYLGLDYQELAKENASFRAKAAAAWAKRDSLTPKYQTST